MKERLRSLKADQTDFEQDPLAELGSLVVELALGLILEGTALVADADTVDPKLDGYEQLEWKQLKAAVGKELRSLSSNELFVIEQHYIKDVTFKMIAQLLDLSAARISQIHKSGIKKMQERLKSFA